MKRFNTDHLDRSVWLFIWEAFEFAYRWTGLRWQRPIEFGFPHFAPWLFGKMTGLKGRKKPDLKVVK